MIDILLPATDAGVVIQIVVVVSFTIAGLVLARSNRDLRIFTLGVGILFLALIAVRAVH